VKTIFGFLLQSSTYTAEVPTNVESEFDLASTIGFSPSAPVQIQSAVQNRVDFAEFGWFKSFEAQARGTRVDVYLTKADPDAIMPVWHVGDRYLWMQLRDRGQEGRSQVLASIVNGVQINEDAFSIPRVRLNGGLVPGNPLTHEINRDHAVFQVHGTTQTLVFRHDESLGTEKTVVSGDFASVSAATDLGVTVLYGGPARKAKELTATARAVAESLELVSR
jgi:hypothetical protein